MAGRKYPFSSFLPRFWLQEIVEELDNTTSTAAAGASSGDLVRPRVEKSFAHPTPRTGLLSVQARQSLDQQDAANDLLDNVASGFDRPVLSRFRAQSPLDRLGLRTQLDDDRREPAQQRLDQAPAQAAGDGAGRPALPIDGAAWLQTVRARTRADVYGASESITCSKLDQLVFDSQRPFSHVRSCLRPFAHRLTPCADGQDGSLARKFSRPRGGGQEARRRSRQFISSPSSLCSHCSVQEPKKMASEFDDEIAAFQQHQHLSVVRLFGHCTSEASPRPMIAIERLSS
jgi:hypothetical protein